MTTFAVLQSLIAQGESETLELKRSTAELKRAGETLCAFLNGEGGKVLIGVSPDGKLVAQDVADITLRDIAAMLGRFEPPAVVLAFAVLLWVAGFDTLYACQDVDFDRREGLRSLPARTPSAWSFVAARRNCSANSRCSWCSTASASPWRRVMRVDSTARGAAAAISDARATASSRRRSALLRTSANPMASAASGPILRPL